MVETDDFCVYEQEFGLAHVEFFQSLVLLVVLNDVAHKVVVVKLHAGGAHSTCKQKCNEISHNNFLY